MRTVIGRELCFISEQSTVTEAIDVHAANFAKKLQTSFANFS